MADDEIAGGAKIDAGCEAEPNREKARYDSAEGLRDDDRRHEEKERRAHLKEGRHQPPCRKCDDHRTDSDRAARRKPTRPAGSHQLRNIP